MKKTLTEILKNYPCDDWKVMIKDQHSCQLFFIKKELNLSREVNTVEAEVTLYIDKEENNKKYRGSASGVFHPEMSSEEIHLKLDFLSRAAQSAMNPWFPLAEPQKGDSSYHENSVFDRHSLPHWTSSLSEALFKADNRKHSWVNSMEIFLTDIRETLVNSRGVDLQFSGYNGMVDLVTTAANNRQEEAELHREHSFSAYEPEELSILVSNQLQYTEDRASAEPMKDLPANLPVILKEQAIPMFFLFWKSISSGEVVYKKIHETALGDSPFESTGDSVTMIGLKRLYNASAMRPFDNNGIVFKEQELIGDGTLKRYHSGIPFAHYLEQPATGEYSCFSILPGTLTEEQLYRDPCLEIISFSDFQMDEITGDFGGEIRLAYYFDGTKSQALTGGSISGSLQRSVPTMRMSESVRQQENFLGPEAIKLEQLSITSVK